MKVKGHYTEEIDTVEHTARLGSILHRLRESKSNALLVRKDERKYGIIARRSIMGSRFDMRKTKVDKATYPVPGVQMQDSLAEAARLMIENQVPLLPVFAGEKVKGQISVDDILDAASVHVLADTSIESVMTENPTTIRPNDSLARVIDLFRSYGISHAPVVSNGKLEGIISIDDLVNVVSRERSRQEGGFGGTRGHGGHGERKGTKRDLGQMPASSVMSAPVIAARPGDSLKDAHHKMKQHDVSSLVIIRDDMVIGMLTKRDLLQPVAQAAMEERRITVQFSAKPDIRMSKEEMAAMRRSFESFVRRYKEVVGVGNLFIYLKRYGAISKGDQLIQCRMQFRTAHTQYYSSAEAWSVEEAYSIALERLERQVIAHKNTKLDDERRRRFLEEQIGSLEPEPENPS